VSHPGDRGGLFIAGRASRQVAVAPGPGPTSALAALLLLAGCLGAPGLAPAQAPALTCEPLCQVPLDTVSRSGWEPHAAIDPRDPLHIAAASRTQGSGPAPATFMLWFDIHVTWDGGRTWNVTPLRYTQPLGMAGADTPNAVGDPVLAFLPDGTLLATGATLQVVPAAVGAALLDVRLYVARSTDGGRHFDAPVTVARSEGVVVQAAPPAPLPALEADALLRMPDKPWLAVGADGTALLTWAQILSYHPDEPTAVRSDIVASASRDGGRSWDAPRLVAKGGTLQGPSPAIGSDGAWHVAYEDLVARQAHVATSRDQGATWSGSTAAPNAWMPSLALGREAGHDRLFLAAAAPHGAGAVDAVPQAPTLCWSDDGGATWSPPLALDAPEAPGRVLQSVAVDQAGVAYVTYAHAKGQGPAAAAELRAVALRPGQWRADLTLDAAIAGPTSSLGDYLGLAAAPEGAFAVWTTLHDGARDTVGARLWASHRS
jgi:hypothetical protein